MTDTEVSIEVDPTPAPIMVGFDHPVPGWIQYVTEITITACFIAAIGILIVFAAAAIEDYRDLRKKEKRNRLTNR